MNTLELRIIFTISTVGDILPFRKLGIILNENTIIDLQHKGYIRAIKVEDEFYLEPTFKSKAIVDRLEALSEVII